MRVLFVNENIGGHRSVHENLRASLPAHPEVQAEFLDVPRPHALRRLAGTSLPVLGGLDADFQALRAQLALSTWVRRRVRAVMHRFDVLHVYTGNAGLRSADLLASMPSVVSTDATNATNAYRLPNRAPSRFTPRTISVAQRWERPVFDSASIVVANTEWIAGSLRHDYGVDESRLRVFPFGILGPDVDDGPAPGAVEPAGLPQLVFVGHQLERKGALRLHRLHQEHLADECELVIVTTEEVPPGKNVRAVHDVTVGSGRLWEVLREAAVFVFPSPIDQAPNAVIEAMAAGLPVVGLRVAAMPHTIPPTCGILLDKDDDQGLVDALRSAGPGPAAARRARRRRPAPVPGRVRRRHLDRAAGRDARRGARAVRRGPIGPMTSTGGVTSRLAGPLSAAGRLLTGSAGRGGGVVLCYHDVVAGPEVDDPWNVTAAQLRTHLRVVRRLGFRFVTLADLTGRALRGEPVDSLAALAFDDALAGVARHGLPILHELGVPSTLMTVSRAWGRPPPWWPGAERTMTRAELAEAVAHGIDLAAHTRSHASLTALADGPTGPLRDEVAGCRDELEDLTGAPVDLFAYPFGHHDPAVRAQVQEAGYAAAFTFLNGRVEPVGPGLDRHRLPRLTMGAHQSAARLTYHLARSAASWPDHQLDRVAGDQTP